MPLTEGLQIPFGIQPVKPLPVNTWEGPYSTIAEALATIPIGVRYPTMEVRILDSINGNKKYWFKDDVTDDGLVEFGSGVSGAGDVVGPTGSTDSNIPLFNGITGKILRDSGYKISDFTLESELTGLTATIESNYNTLNNLITGETSRSEGVETGLTTSINSEIYNRITGDTFNYNLNTGETQNRILGDTSLENEITGLTATVNSNQISLNNALTGETQNRITQNNILQNEITGLTATISEKEPKLGNPTEDGQVLSSSISGVRSWITGASGKGITSIIRTSGNGSAGTVDTYTITYTDTTTFTFSVTNGLNGNSPTIGGNGNWWLGTADTGVKATGTDGYTPVKGVDYVDGTNGTSVPVNVSIFKSGANGIIPATSFSWISNLVVSAVIIQDYATDISATINGTVYNKTTLIGVHLDLGVKMTNLDMTIITGQNTGSATIIF